MSVYIFRRGLLVAMPADYAAHPRHQALVTKLTRATRYVEAVRLLDAYVDESSLAADVMTGAPWVARFLATTARFTYGTATERTQARQGWRVLMRLVAGERRETGRKRHPALDPADLQRALAAIARWAEAVHSIWSVDRARWPVLLADLAPDHFLLAKAHLAELRRLARHRALRKRELVLTLASWETGISKRRLRHGPTVELVYQ